MNSFEELRQLMEKFPLGSIVYNYGIHDEEIPSAKFLRKVVSYERMGFFKKPHVWVAVAVPILKDPDESSKMAGSRFLDLRSRFIVIKTLPSE